MRRALPFARPQRTLLGIVIAAALGATLITAVQPLIIRRIIDEAIMPRFDAAVAQPLAPLLGLLVLLGVVRFGLSFVRRFLTGKVSVGIENDLRSAVYDHLQRLDFAAHDRLQSGQLVSRANEDVRMLQQVFTFLPMMGGSIFLFVASVGFMLALSPALTVVALVFVPVLGVMTYRMRHDVYPASWDVQERRARVTTVVEEAVTGVRVVKGFGQEHRMIDRLVEAATALFGGFVRQIRIAQKRQVRIATVPMFGQVAMLGLGGALALQGRVTIGTFVAFMTYFAQLVGPVAQFAQMMIVVQQVRAGAERVFELLDSAPEVVERPDAVELVHLMGAVRFEEVTFGYRGSGPVLRDLSLDIEPGETIALIGPSGCGKSTMGLLLPRFYEVQAGRITVDGIDVRDVTLHSLRRHMGVAFEESFLFSMSVRDNIAYAYPDAGDEEVVAAAKAAQAHEFIVELPDGYGTMIGERGLTLSGGQRQRIALARALLSDPGILMLDDATSAVDAGTEQAIHETMRRIMAGRTTIVIAHRRSTLQLADRVAVLEGGRVTAVGSHEEVMAASPFYRLLVSGQEDLDELLADVDGAHRTADGGDADGPAPSAAAASEGTAAFFWGGPSGEMREAIEALPPVVDEPKVDVSAQLRAPAELRLLRFLRPYAKELGVGFLLVASATLAQLAGPRIVAFGIDAGVQQQHAPMLWLAVGLFAAAALAGRSLQYRSAVWTSRAGGRMLFALRIRIFAHLQRLGLDYYEREMAGRILTRMTSDIQTLNNLFQQGAVMGGVQLLSLLGAIGVMLTMSVRLTLVVLGVLPPLVVATWWFRRRSDVAYLEVRDRIAAVNADFQESVSGVRVSQAFTRERRNTEQFRRIASDYGNAYVEAQRLSSMYFPVVEFLSLAATALILGAGAWLIERDALSIGALIAFSLYVTSLFAPIQQLSNLFDVYQQGKAALQRLRELLATPPIAPEPEEPISPGRLRGEIVFRDVSFTYPRTTTVALGGVDLHIHPGETVALVGDTGAGKSTIVKLIARFYDPTRGTITVDGLPVDRLDASYKQQIGFVPQEPFLFAGTIAENIAFARPDAPRSAIEAAARSVGAHAFIVRLPDGYDTMVGERGGTLSGGQRQLVSLSRAYLVDPAILLLDEATSNLDLASETAVSRGIGVLSGDRTTILIAHRLQTAMRADRILVVDEGRIVEDGPHAELLAHGGRYARLWRVYAGSDGRDGHETEAAPRPGAGLEGRPPEG